VPCFGKNSPGLSSSSGELLQTTNCLNVSMRQSRVVLIKRTGNLIAETCVMVTLGRTGRRKELFHCCQPRTRGTPRRYRTLGWLPAARVLELGAAGPRGRRPLDLLAGASPSVCRTLRLLSCRRRSSFGATPSEAPATDVFRKGKSLRFIRFSSAFSQDHMVYVDVLYTSHLADD